MYEPARRPTRRGGDGCGDGFSSRYAVVLCAPEAALSAEAVEGVGVIGKHVEN